MHDKMVKGDANIGKLKNKLQGMNDQDLHTNLDNHIQAVFNKLITCYPDQALAKLEEVSYLLKHKPDSLGEWLRTEDCRSYSQSQSNG